MPDEYGWNVTSSFDDCAPDRRRERPPRRIDVVDDVFDFGPGEAPADVDAHCVQERCSKEHLEVLDADVVDERHPALRPDTVGGEPLSDLRRSDGELGPTDRAFFLDQDRSLGLVGPVDATGVSKAVDVAGGRRT